MIQGDPRHSSKVDKLVREHGGIAGHLRRNGGFLGRSKAVRIHGVLSTLVDSLALGTTKNLQFRLCGI